MNKRLPTLSDAAEQLGIGPRKLMAELRRRKIIDSQNFACRHYVVGGQLRLEQREYVDRNSKASKSYWVTTVTDDGLYFLREIADALRGTKQLRAGNGADRATAEPESTPVFDAGRAGSVCGVAQ